MAGFHCVIDEILVVASFFENQFYVREVGIQYFWFVIQLAADTAG